MTDDADTIREGKPATRSIPLYEPPECFGPSEIEELAPVIAASVDEGSFLAGLAKSVQFEDAYSSARNWNHGEGLFLTWPSKVAGPLLCAYRLYLALRMGGEGAMKIALRDEYFKKHRLRLPRSPKPELVAIQIVAKPIEHKDRISCSDYAKFLVKAYELRVQPEAFAARMAEIPLKVRKPAKRPTELLRASVDTKCESSQQDAVASQARIATLTGSIQLLNFTEEVTVTASVKYSKDFGWIVEIIEKEVPQ